LRARVPGPSRAPADIDSGPRHTPERPRARMSSDVQKKHLRRQLLGDLPEEALDELEARYFADADIFARLLAEEDALTAAYLRGELSPAERALFEKNVLSSADGRRRLRTTGG